VRSRFEGPIDLVMGGYHLLNARPSRIEAVIEAFMDTGVQRVAPCHCTGPRASGMFRVAFGDRYLNLRVGDQIEV
jgi:7,8-dihydropterin-6-yl-methyl-4-(beta-D-ribofuranosyl)aminobenzene 5'-phosphate synthase